METGRGDISPYQMAQDLINESHSSSPTDSPEAVGRVPAGKPAHPGRGEVLGPGSAALWNHGQTILGVLATTDISCSCARTPLSKSRKP